LYKDRFEGYVTNTGYNIIRIDLMNLFLQVAFNLVVIWMVVFICLSKGTKILLRNYLRLTQLDIIYKVYSLLV
jgi:hypothetical protein